MKDWRDHIGDPSIYQHRAFARRHDVDISMLPWRTCLWGREIQQWGTIFLLLPNSIQAHWDAPAFFWVRKGASHGDQCCPCPASPQQLGVRQGLRYLVRVLRATPRSGHLPSLLQGEEAREKLMGELQRHRRKSRPPLFQQSYKGWRENSSRCAALSTTAPLWMASLCTECKKSS